MSVNRILAYATRHLYLYKRSLPRFMEVFYWPLLDLLIWGFVSVYLARKSSVPNVISFFLGALILWDILFRSQQGISISFLEDVWSRNLINIFVSPLSPSEYIASLLVISIVKLVLTSTVLIALAWLFYSFDIFLLGFSLVPLVANLIIMGWWIGIITTAFILRFGQEAEILAWGIALLFQPVSAVFYPVSVLPPWLRGVAWFIPASHVFEGMRQVISGGAFPTNDLARASVENIFYVGASILFFWWNFREARKKGRLAKVGE